MSKTKRMIAFILCFLTLLTTLNLEGISITHEVLANTGTAHTSHTDACYNGTLHTCSGNTSSGGTCYTYSTSLTCGILNVFKEWECSSCSATGTKNGYHYAECSTCDGSGNGDWVSGYYDDCSNCSGNGTVTTSHDWSYVGTTYGETHGCGESGDDEVVSYDYECDTCGKTYGYKPYRYCSGCAELGSNWYYGSINGCEDEGSCSHTGRNGYCQYTYTGSYGTSCKASCSDCGGDGEVYVSGYYEDCDDCGGDGEYLCGRYTDDRFKCNNCGGGESGTSGDIHYKSGYYKSCGKSSGSYYNGNTLVTSVSCNTIIKGIEAVKGSQTITSSGDLNVQVYLRYLDETRSDNPVTATATNFNASSTYTNQPITLSYTGKSTAAGATKAFTTTTSVTTNYVQDVIYEDRVDSSTGKLLGSYTSKDVAYGTAVSGKDRGTNTTTGAYYEGYYYNGNYTSATVGSSTVKVYRYFSAGTFPVTVIDVHGTNSSGTELGRTSKTGTYASTVQGSIAGTSTTVGAYHKDYVYTGCSSATVGTSGTTVYRYFNYVPFKVGSNVTVTPYSNKYDGNAHGITVTSTISGVTIKYGTTAGSYTSTSSPTFTNVGTYTVYYQVSKTGYTPLTGSSTVTITKANHTLGFSENSATSFYPNEKTHTFTVNTNVSGGTLTVSSSNPSVATVSISGNTVTITNVGIKGTATITVNSAATSNYNASSKTYSYTVDYSDHLVTCVDINTATGKQIGTAYSWYAEYGTIANPTTAGTSITVGAYYTDYKYVSAGTTATVGENGCVVYRYFEYVPFVLGENVTSSGYTGIYDTKSHGITVNTTISGATIKYGTASGSYTTTTNPTYTDVGTYTVYYQVSKTGYTPLTGSQTVKITKADHSLTLSAITGTSDFPVNKTHSFTVTKNISGGTITATSSDTSIATVTVSNNNTINITNVGKKGTVTITVNSAATNNYNATSTTYTYTVTYSQLTVTCHDVVGSTSGTVLKTHTWKAEYGTVASGATTLGKDTTVGAYHTDYTYKSCTTATVGESGCTIYRIFNYTPLKVGSNVMVLPVSVVYDGNPHGITITSTIPGVTIKYGTASGTYNLTSSPTYTDVGVYTVYFQISKTGYTTITGSAKVTITQKNNYIELSSYEGRTEYPNTSKHTFTVTVNESGGTLRVTSSNEAVAKVSISGNTVTITNAGGKGTATITVTSDETRNYFGAYTEFAYEVTYNKETVTYVDVIVSNIDHPKTGQELGRINKQVTYKNTVKGSDIGSTTTTGEYYKGYNYTSCTEAVVPDGGITVYRYFTPQTYTVTLTAGDYINSVSGTGTYYYDSYVTISADVFDTTDVYVYTWKGWTGTFNQSANEYTFTMPNYNVTLSTNVERTYNLHRQIVYARYQQPDGSWSSWVTEIDEEYFYNSTVSWSSPATEVYKAASITDYVVKGTNTTYVDVYRQQYVQTLYIRYQNPDASYESYQVAIQKPYYYDSEFSWSYAGSAEYLPNSIKYTVKGTTTEYLDIQRNKHIFCIEGLLDGTPYEGLREYGTFDLYINGKPVVDGDASFISSKVLYGSTYEITNIQANTGFNYDGAIINGVSVGNKTTISGTITEDSSVVIEMTANYYTVIFKDVVDSEDGKVLGTYTDSYKYGSTVVGTVLGTNSTDNWFHSGYYYHNATSIVVKATDTGNIVYRIFKLRTLDISGTVNWVDNSNEYGSRQESVTITLYRDGEVFKTREGLTSKDINNFSFNNLQKYSTDTGIAYTYTVDISEVVSMNSDDKYVTERDGNTFTNYLKNNGQFIVQGAIIWEDAGNEGYRPADIRIELYQNGTKVKQTILKNTATAYTFTGLDKYDENLEPFVYTTKEIFTAQYLVETTPGNYETLDSYTISVNELDFTNTFIIPEGDIVPVKPEFNNKLTFSKNVGDNINIVLKQFKTHKDDNGNTTYSTTEYNGFTYNFTLGNNTNIDYITAGRYEIVLLGNEYSIRSMVLETSNQISLIEENGRYYIEITDTNEDMSGKITLTLDTNNHVGYQTTYESKCYWATVNYGAYLLSMSMFSDEVMADMPKEFKVIYNDSETVDEAVYYDLEGFNFAYILDFVGELPENQEFLGWATTQDAKEPEYLPDDEVTLKKTLELYPVFSETEKTETATGSALTPSTPEEEELAETPVVLPLLPEDEELANTPTVLPLFPEDEETENSTSGALVPNENEVVEEDTEVNNNESTDTDLNDFGIELPDDELITNEPVEDTTVVEEEEELPEENSSQLEEETSNVTTNTNSNEESNVIVPDESGTMDSESKETSEETLEYPVMMLPLYEDEVLEDTSNLNSEQQTESSEAVTEAIPSEQENGEATDSQLE